MPGKERNDDDGDQPRVDFRWGHSEGVTAVDCFQDGDTEKLVTSGCDSGLRIWKSFKDEDPIAHDLTDNGLTLLCRDGKAYVGTEFNTVELLSLEDGKNLGVKAKFTAPVHHLDLSSDGKWLVAGSGDMTIQIINLEETSNPPFRLNTHTAPVLSVALDPQTKFLASSGCDGDVCIWSLADECKPVHVVKKFEKVFPSSNDITTSETLCRISWGMEGKILAVPEEEHVALYARESWVKLKVLKAQKSKKGSSVTKFSPCGTYIASGGIDGTLIVWKVKDSEVLAEHAQYPDQITGLVFTNNSSDLVAVDKKGRVLLLKDFKTPPKITSKPTDARESISDDIDNPSSPADDVDNSQNDGDAFNDGLDDLFADGEDNEISISKIKAETGFVGDEYVGIDKAKKVIIGGDLDDGKDSDNDDARSVSSVGSGKPRSSRLVAPAPRIVIPFTEPQKPFQPASSPEHLTHRFLIWNNTGIIRNYSIEDDEKDAIDIEFHDAAVHHAIHLRNQFDYTLATLTKEVAVFANEKTTGVGSKLFCYSFTSWDSKKEWCTELPAEEEVIGLAAGDGWLAASSDMNRIRIFTIGGAQKQIIDVGGQIITTSGHEDLLFITFHSGIGLHGNQCIAYSIFRIKPSLKPFPLVSCEPLPISPKSQVTWIGFSDEGTPVCSDSEDVLRILSGRYWTPFCTMKEHLAGASDHFWVVGVSELMQRIRAVKCKGMKYPPALPRPVLMQLDAQMPFCEMETEKSRLEDRLHRSLMLDALSKKMDKKNYDVDEYKTQAEKELKESLFNLFVLSCKGDWDARGTEYVSMMPSAHAVQVAVKYASKLRKKGLVDRLTAVGRRKLDEEDLAVEGDDDDFETLKMGTIVYSSVQNRIFSTTADYSASQDLFTDSTSGRFNTSTSSFSNSFSAANRSINAIPDEENPFMKRNTDEIRKLLGSTDTSSNRFRKEKVQEAASESNENKGLSVIDTWKKPSEKPTDLFSKVNIRNSRTKKGAEKEKQKEKELAANKDKKKQATLLDMHGKKSSKEAVSNPDSPMVADISEESNDSAMIENQGEVGNDDDIVRNSESLLEDSTNIQHSKPDEPPKRKTPFFLWLDENRADMEKEHPDISNAELTKIGMQRFKKLSKEDKQKYLKPPNDNEKKRKRSELEDEEPSKNENDGEKKSKITSKLAAFIRTSSD